MNLTKLSKSIFVFLCALMVTGTWKYAHSQSDIRAHAVNLNSERVARIRTSIPGTPDTYRPNIQVWIYDGSRGETMYLYDVDIQFGKEQPRTQRVRSESGSAIAWFDVDAPGEVQYTVNLVTPVAAGKAE